MSRTDGVLVFIHGWPDTERLWDAQVEAFEGRYRCIRFTLPGFEQGSRRAYSFDEVIGHIHQVIDSACRGEQVTLVLHDWGCVFGYAFAARYPERVARIVAADIGDAGSRRHLRELGIPAKLMTAAYQLYLATAWRIGGRIGDVMSRIFARLMGAPAAAQDIHAGMAYPYAVMWFGVRGGRPKGRLRPPDVPMLFVYGERKPFMFHSRAWARDLAVKPGCRVVSLPAGHWMMVTCAEAFNSAVLEWLEEAC
ncbi:MAG: alpha/beta hydrolase [Gemmatimonadaceae bacterium]|nr:alpha/beta hydrolase [Gemmatimonadaceae bacterium]